MKSNIWIHKWANNPPNLLNFKFNISYFCGQADGSLNKRERKFVKELQNIIRNIKKFRM